MKTGTHFSSFYDMRKAMLTELGVAFSQMGAYISHLQGHPNVCCAKHVFYDIGLAQTKCWNEFESQSEAIVAKNWNDNQWLTSAATATIHEILSPLINPAKPGARADGRYEPVIDPKTGKFEEATTRLVFGNFRNSAGHRGNSYVFLGVYEIDLPASKNINGYSVDAASYPLTACKMKSNTITYPHQVWKRVSDEWDK